MKRGWPAPVMPFSLSIRRQVKGNQERVQRMTIVDMVPLLTFFFLCSLPFQLQLVSVSEHSTEPSTEPLTMDNDKLLVSKNQGELEVSS